MLLGATADRPSQGSGNQVIGLTTLAVIAAGCAGSPASPRPVSPSTAESAALPAEPSKADVTVRGSRVFLNGQPATLLGFRVGSAPLRDDWTEQLLGQLDLWKRHGINGFIVWLQGTSGGYTRFFTADGRSIGTDRAPVLIRTGYGLDERVGRVSWGETSGREVVSRTLRIVDEAGRRGMVVIVGLIYGSSVEGSDTTQGLVQGIGEVGRAFAGRRNVILDIWNEASVKRPLSSSAAMGEYARALKRTAPERPVCVGSTGNDSNKQYAQLPEIDLICQDAGGTARSALLAMDELRASGKPIINVETFGGHGGGYWDDTTTSASARAGYYLDFGSRGGFRRAYGVFLDGEYEDATGRKLAGRRDYESIIAAAVNDPEKQIHLMVHVAGWFQGASRTERSGQVGRAGAPGEWGNAFFSGAGPGEGTLAAPGVAWILRAAARAGRPAGPCLPAGPRCAI
jgi:hypothetical protein